LGSVDSRPTRTTGLEASASRLTWGGACKMVQSFVTNKDALGGKMDSTQMPETGGE